MVAPDATVKPVLLAFAVALPPLITLVPNSIIPPLFTVKNEYGLVLAPSAKPVDICKVLPLFT